MRATLISRLRAMAPPAPVVVGALSGALLTLFLFAAQARGSLDPVDFVDGLGNAVIDTLAAPDLAPFERRTRLRAILKENVDLDGMARRALGRYWRSATSDQRAAFLALFEELMVRIYGRHLVDYADARFDLTGLRREGPRAVLVHSRIVPRWGRALSVDWRVQPMADGWSVSEVVIEGLSMTVMLRSNFAPQLDRGGMEGLIESLRSRIETADLAG